MLRTHMATEYVPNYVWLYESGELERRVENALASLEQCRVCSWDCQVNRLQNQTKVCRTGRYARIASYFPHFGEEDCLRGWQGSGTIFFAWCNLRCVFCFHPDTFISTDRGVMRIADIFERGSGERPWHGGEVRFGDGSVRVVTREGKLAKVAKMFRHGFTGDLVKVKPFNCPPLLLTPDHNVFVLSKRAPDRIVKMPAADLTREHYLLVPRYLAVNAATTLDVAVVLSSQHSVFRKTPFRTAALQLATLFAQPRTSFALAEVTGYHPAYVRKLRGQWRNGELRTDNEALAVNALVEEEGCVRFQTERRPGIPAQLTMNARLAWLLGIYCAEGHVTTQKDRPNSHRLIFSFGHHETHLAEQAHQWLHELFGVSPTVYRRRTTITVEVGKASLALLFASLCGRNANEKQVPSLVYGASPDILQAYLNGVLDGDGCDRGTHLVVNTVSTMLAHGLFAVGLRLGMLPSIHLWQSATTTHIEGREVQQSPLYYVKFPQIHPLNGQRRSRWPATAHWYVVPMHKIERVPYDGPVFNLEVDDPDHSYVASFVAVSNCQNYDISQQEAGLEVQPEQLAGMMLELQAMGCHNINWVTPEHVVPQILEALPHAIRGGLRLPIVYNTSAFDSLDSLRHMDGIVDIYMPDFKYWHPEQAKRYLKSPKYPETARAAIKEMHRQVGDLTFDERGLARRGLLVRHLVMPGGLEETRHIMRFLAMEVSPHTYVNIMDQYYPAGKVSKEKYPELCRRTTSKEVRIAFDLAREAGLHRFDEHWLVAERSWS